MSDEVIFAKPAGRRDMDVAKTDDKSSWEQRLSMKLLHCSNFNGTLPLQSWEIKSDERGERKRGRERKRERERTHDQHAQKTVTCICTLLLLLHTDTHTNRILMHMYICMCTYL